MHSIHTEARQGDTKVSRMSRKILFVDDEPQVRHLFSRQLERYGYEVDLAGSPGDALALVADCLLYTSPSPRDQRGSRMPSSA